MRLVSYGPPGAERAALLLEAAGASPGTPDWVVDVGRASAALRPEAALPDTMLELLRRQALAGLASLVPAIEERLRDAGAAGFPPRTCLPRDRTRLGPPVPEPSKIVCVGLNYRDHALEQGKEPPERPLLFAKAPSALAGPDDAIRITPGITQLDYELELGVVVGRVARRVPAERAMECVAGYLLFLDMTDREAQYGDKQWFRGKSHDTFAPTGPWMSWAPAVADPGALPMRLEVNGTVVQESSTAQMIHSIPELIAYTSRTITLAPGDIIATGTPAGVGVFQKPPRFLAAGDALRAEIARLGVLSTRVELEG